MIEIIDNSLQFAATLACCLLALAQYLCAQKQAQFLLACFYGCFSLGLLYWTLYLVLYETTPGTFYVSEIVWISSCIFLYLLQYTLASPAEREYRCRAMYIAPALGVAMFAIYCAFDTDVPADLLRCCAMSAIAWNAIRGLGFGGRRRFHIAALCFVCAEYALWASSIGWRGDTLANPYFWIDFALTGILISLLPAAGKGAGA